MYSKFYITFFYFIIIIFFISCNDIKNNNSIKITTTTNIIGEIIKNIVKDFNKITILMISGVDPHLYKATQGDLYKINNSNILFYNGLYLEGKMSDLFIKLSRIKNIYAISNAISLIKLIKDPNFSNGIDPHIWFDINLLMQSIKYINKILQKKDFFNSFYYTKSTKKYLNELFVLNKLVKKDIYKININQRVLITAHDAFSYFGRSYNIKVKALQGISTVSEFGIKDISNLVKFIIYRNIKSIFLETSVPDKPLRAVIEGCKSKGYNVFIGGSLYSDTMGELYTFEGTYKGMLITNTQIIVNSLK